MRVRFDASEVRRNLARVEAELQTKLIDEAVEKAAKRLHELVVKHPNTPRSNIPGGSRGLGHGQDNFLEVKVENGYFLVGVHKDYFYLYFHEVGARSVSGKTPSGRNFKTPATPAKPFLRPTLENNAEEFQRIMGLEIKKGLGLY